MIYRCLSFSSHGLVSDEHLCVVLAAPSCDVDWNKTAMQYIGVVNVLSNDGCRVVICLDPQTSMDIVV
jgi:hypothetical protein